MALGFIPIIKSNQFGHFSETKSIRQGEKKMKQYWLACFVTSLGLSAAKYVREIENEGASGIAARRGRAREQKRIWIIFS